MASVLHSLIPTPLTGMDFMKSSHFQLGQDRRLIEKSMKTTFQSCFPPVSGFLRPEAVPPLEPAQILPLDRHSIRDYLSETAAAFKNGRLETERLCPASSLFLTNFKMHSDPKVNAFSTNYTEIFTPHAINRGPKMTEASKFITESHVPSGDIDKLLPPPPSYSSSYQGYDVRCYPVVKAPTLHLGGVPTIKGDGHARYGSTYRAEFEGRWTPPSQPVEKQTYSSIVSGDPEKIHEMTTVQKHSFTDKEARHYKYNNKTEAAAELNWLTTFKLGDNRETGHGTTTSDTYRATKGEPVIHFHRSSNASFLPEGDTDPDRNRERKTATTNHIDYIKLDLRERQPLVDGSQIRTKSNVQFGEPRHSSHYYTTVNDSTYKPVITSRIKVNKKHDFLQSSVPLDYCKNALNLTTAQNDFQPPKQGRQALSESRLHQMKYSHITPPLKQQCFFGTTYGETFTPKRSDPPDLHPWKWCSSQVPLGTLSGTV